LGTPVPKEIKEQRWHRLMAHQQAISQKRLKRRIGNREQIIIDEVGPGGGKGLSKGLSKGRSKGDAPQIDGAVHVTSRRPLRVGEIATVRIERADAYDLHGMVVGY
jgi:ribosomal protein S12 methylthiotransferase